MCGLRVFEYLMLDVGGPSKGWIRKGEEGCSIETAMYSVYILNQERNHVTKSHVKIQFTVYRVNSGAGLTLKRTARWPPYLSDGMLNDQRRNYGATLLTYLWCWTWRLVDQNGM
jgi:hypothetical protein